MEPQENQALPTGTEVAETPVPVEQAVEVAAGEEKPTENVKNFWERLDDVFKQNEQMKERMDDLVSQFPDFQRTSKIGDSALFQPSRVSINSKDSIQTTLTADVAFAQRTQNESYNAFRVRLKKSCVNVKSVQLLSAIIPVPQNSFPPNENRFCFYKIPTVAAVSMGAWSTLGMYSIGSVVTYNGNYYYLNRPFTSRGTWLKTTQYFPGDVVYYFPDGNYYYCQSRNINIIPNSGNAEPGTNIPYWVNCGNNPVLTTPDNMPFFWNIIGAVGPADAGPYWFALTSLLAPVYLNSIVFLNFSSSPPESFPNPVPAFNRLFPLYTDLVDNLNLAANDPNNTSVPGRLTFRFNDTYQKIEMEPTIPFQTEQFFYLPCGFEDANVKAAFPNLYQPMNVRLGFTATGSLPGLIDGKFSPNFNPFVDDDFFNAATEYICPNPNYYPPNPDPSSKTFLTFPSFPDLLYTSACLVYVDFAGGSTQDSEGQGNLLSVVPLNSTQLGVGFYQNNFNNPLTKIPSVLTEFNIVLKTDKGFPYLLPNRATVLLELALEYK